MRVSSFIFFFLIRPISITHQARAYEKFNLCESLRFTTLQSWNNYDNSNRILTVEWLDKCMFKNRYRIIQNMQKDPRGGTRIIF